MCGLKESVTVTPAELTSLYIPLLTFIQTRRASQPLTIPRLLVGCFGPAGSGKTTLAALLCEMANAIPGFPKTAGISMDAYHQTNSWLESNHLRPFKGRIDTINGEALCYDLKLLLQPPSSLSTLCPPQEPLPPIGPPLESRQSWADFKEGNSLLLPIYDRAVTHDPKLGGCEIAPDVQVVLVEGLFLGRGEEGATYAPCWPKVRGTLHEVIGLNAPLPLCRARCITRRLRSILYATHQGGLPSDLGSLGEEVLEKLNAAVEHYKRADYPTFKEIRGDLKFATVVVTLPLPKEMGGSGGDEGVLRVGAKDTVQSLRGDPGMGGAVIEFL